MVPNAARVAKNESLFREVNERIFELEESFGERTPDESLTAFLCECSRVECVTKVEMSVTEYRAVRARPAQFLIDPGHINVTYERIVRRTDDRFTVVEKLGLAGELAAEEAP